MFLSLAELYKREEERERRCNRWFNAIVTGFGASFGVYEAVAGHPDHSITGVEIGLILGALAGLLLSLASRGIADMTDEDDW